MTGSQLPAPTVVSKDYPLLTNRFFISALLYPTDNPQQPPPKATNNGQTPRLDHVGDSAARRGGGSGERDADDSPACWGRRQLLGCHQRPLPSYLQGKRTACPIYSDSLAEPRWMPLSDSQMRCDKCRLVASSPASAESPPAPTSYLSPMHAPARHRWREKRKDGDKRKLKGKSEERASWSAE